MANEQQLGDGWVAINKPGIWRFDGATATFVADSITDDMVERANASYLGEGWERDYHPPGQEANRADMRVALKAAIYGSE